MAFGAEVRNAAGNMVIDMTYRNLSLQRKQTFSLAARASLTVTQTGAVAPLMAIQADNYVGMQGMYVSGTSFSWIITAGATAATGACYIYDKPHASHVSSFGLAVYDDAGVEIFNSDNKYLRVVSVMDVPWSAYYSGPDYFYETTGATASASLPTSNYAVCLSQSRSLVQLINTSNYTYQVTFDGVKTTTTSAFVSQVCTTSFIAGGSNYFPGVFALSGSGTKPALVIDVTGL